MIPKQSRIFQPYEWRLVCTHILHRFEKFIMRRPSGKVRFVQLQIYAGIQTYTFKSSKLIKEVSDEIKYNNYLQKNI